MPDSPPDDDDWYETPLFYDIVFDEDTARETDFLEQLCLRHQASSRRGKTVLEPACGSGRLIREFATRGWKVSGFDRSEAMLDFARNRFGPDDSMPSLWQDDLETFSLPSSHRFDLVHCLVSTFKYIETEGGALSCLQRIADCLKPGGLFVLGLHLTDYGHRACHHERWVAERDGYEVVCNTRTWPADRRRRQEALRTRLRIRHPDGSHSLQETRWQFRTYSARQLSRLLGEIEALEIVACHDFHYDLSRERELDDRYEDLVVVLRRRS